MVEQVLSDARPGRLRDAIALARPRDWLKGVFVLAPVPFAVADGVRPELLPFVLGLAAFCLTSSAVYAFNDVVDAERDRRHPTKRHRPVAAGRLSRGAALLEGGLLLVAGLALGWATGRPLGLAVLAAYVLLELVYCLRGRQLPLVDVGLLSSGFVLRVLMGCALLGVMASSWLLLCSSSLALFLALAKRRGDFRLGVEPAHRPALGGYSLPFLDQAMGVTAALTLGAYAIYCMEAPVLLAGRQFAALPFALLGVLEYLRQVHVRDDDADPVTVLLGSPTLIVASLGWIAATLWSLRPPV